MKKKIVTMILVMAVSATAMVGCGSKQNGSQAPQESTAAQESTESSEAASTISGTLDEVKSFMFVVTDDQGASYAFTFSGDKPEGLDKAVSYTHLLYEGSDSRHGGGDRYSGGPQAGQPGDLFCAGQRLRRFHRAQNGMSVPAWQFCGSGGAHPRCV